LVGAKRQSTGVESRGTKDGHPEGPALFQYALLILFYPRKGKRGTTADAASGFVGCRGIDDLVDKETNTPKTRGMS